MPAPQLTKNVMGAPLIVGVGGGVNSASSTERALALSLDEARRMGAETILFGGEHLARIPHYLTQASSRDDTTTGFLSAIRSADGIILASPGYHGSLSGIVKNAIDHIEETARDERPYLTDLPIGLIAVAGGAQAATSTLLAMRTIVHALRGWPTPFGAAIVSQGSLFTADRCTDPAVERQLRLVGEQVTAFAMRMRVCQSAVAT
jgi:FMN reductase